MIANLYTEESPAARMLDMIARCAPRLMRCGGGPLSREDDYRKRASTMTPEKRAHIVELAKSGKFTKVQISEMTGATRAVVAGICARDGIVTLDGREQANKRRANG